MKIPSQHRASVYPTYLSSVGEAFGEHGGELREDLQAEGALTDPVPGGRDAHLLYTSSPSPGEQTVTQSQGSALGIRNSAVCVWSSKCVWYSI